MKVVIERIQSDMPAKSPTSINRFETDKTITVNKK